jgi:hypothetical protein
MERKARDLMFDALMEGVPQDLEPMVEIALDDIARIEPIVDDLVAQALAQGRFEALLEVTYAQLTGIYPPRKPLQTSVEGA